MLFLPDHPEPLLVPPFDADHIGGGEPTGCDCCGRPAPIERLQLLGARWLCVRCARAELAA